MTTTSVTSGHNLDSSTFGSGSTVLVLSGGSISANEFKSGSTVSVTGGGQGFFDRISAGAAEVVLSGATISQDLIDSGGILQVLSGGTVDTTGILGTAVAYTGGTIENSFGSGGSLNAFGGLLLSNLINDATVTVYPGGSAAYDYLSGFGTLETIKDGGSSTDEFFLNASGVVSSGGVATRSSVGTGATMTVASGGMANAMTVYSGGMAVLASEAVESGLIVSSGGQVVLEDVAYTPKLTAFFNIIFDELVIEAPGSAPVYLPMAKSEPINAILAPTLTNSGGVLEVTFACYCVGTLIRTPGGDVAVETLAAGDLVTTASGAARPVRWVGHRTVDGRFVRGNRAILPVCIRAGALADGVPARDLWLSPEHALFLDGALVPARELINGMTIVQAQHVDRVEYFHIELDSHDILLAEGTQAESYAEDGNLAMFHNASDRPPTAAPSQYCAPRLSAGYALEAIRRRINQRALHAA